MFRSEHACYHCCVTVSTDAILETATRVLAASPTATLADVARAAGISRTTLFMRFATRDELLLALAVDAIDHIDAAILAARITDASQDPVVALADLTEAMMPLGARLGYLLRERSLDDNEELQERWSRIDRTITDAVRRAQAADRVRADLPALWVSDAWFWLVVAAWEGVEAGRIAPVDGARLVITTLLDGTGSR
jgi:AcrR family transcriptional regulator